METLIHGTSFDEALKKETINVSEVETEIAKLIKEKPGLTVGGYMGLIMQKYKGKVSGKEIMDILKKLVK
jgi:Glu-tRNA(Gln) amidotransferase subunit E-like FAD-binding protein